MVAPTEVVPAAPAPLKDVHAQVANDWMNAKATERARAVAAQIEAKVERGMPLAQAVKDSGAAIPPAEPVKARRIQIATAQGQIPAPLKMLFTLSEGKSRVVPDPQRHAFFIVKVNKITPGNAMMEPTLIGRMQGELQQGMSDDYAREFLAAMRKELGAERNTSAIQAMKTRMMSSGG
jgi:peptidyl-prolyl cis-trans isomerase D